MVSMKGEAEMTWYKHSNAFTLIELVMVILLLGVLASVMVYFVGVEGDATRFDETKSRMDTIRNAILGDTTVDKEGHRQHFGYHGDWGSLPGSLSKLVTSQTPDRAIDSTYGIGGGWRGPYLDLAFVGSQPITKDLWGRDFVYSSGSSPPSLVSYGADAIAGGSVYNQDLTLTFESVFRLATVRGIVADGETRLSEKSVEIHYPVAGTLTSFTTTTDANGSFSFPNVPFGVRSVKVVSPPVLGPRQVVVDSSEFQVPSNILNYFGKLQEVTYVSGSASTSGPSNSHVNATLQSTYTSTLQLDYVTTHWSGVTGGYLEKLTLNGIHQGIGNVPSGTRVDIAATQTLPANSSTNTIRLEFTKNADGTGNMNMATAILDMTLEWTTTKETDTVIFSPGNP